VTAWNETGADVPMTREQIAECLRLSRDWLVAHPTAAITPPSPLCGTQPHLAIQQCFTRPIMRVYCENTPWIRSTL
jgi:hypothetical protein